MNACSQAAAVIRHGIGSISRVGGASALSAAEVALFNADVQRWLETNTPHGLPALIHEEGCSGAAIVGAVVFPQPLAVAATWDVDEAGAVGGHTGWLPLPQ